MKMQRLDSTDGFIALDLDDAPVAVGAVRLAPKILADGAQLLARSLTYQFASFERKVGGASAGINARPEDRDAALAAFVTEIAPLVEARTFLPQPARGVTDADLAPLRAADPRNELFWSHGIELRARSAVAAADTALGGLSGRTIAVEGLDDSSIVAARLVAERGGRVVGVSSAAGSVADVAGLDVDALADSWAAHGADLVAHLGPDQKPADELFGLEVEALFVGSKAGVVDHEVAAGVRARAVVPTGPVPVTAKALAVLRRAGAVVVPDFLSTAGPLFAMWPDAGATIDTVRSAADEAVASALGEVLGHEDGPLLAACYRAESFLGTWQDSLPFGRPMA